MRATVTDQGKESAEVELVYTDSVSRDERDMEGELRTADGEWRVRDAA